MTFIPRQIEAEAIPFVDWDCCSFTENDEPCGRPVEFGYSWCSFHKAIVTEPRRRELA